MMVGGFPYFIRYVHVYPLFSGMIVQIESIEAPQLTVALVQCCWGHRG